MAPGVEDYVEIVASRILMMLVCEPAPVPEEWKQDLMRLNLSPFPVLPRAFHLSSQSYPVNRLMLLIRSTRARRLFQSTSIPSETVLSYPILSYRNESWRSRSLDIYPDQLFSFPRHRIQGIRP